MNKTQNIQQTNKINDSKGKAIQIKMQRSLDYAQIRTLKNQNNIINKFLPGLQLSLKSFRGIKSNNKNKNSTFYQKQQSQLLLTAVEMVRKKQQEFQYFESQTQKLGISHYFNSRTITPINPIIGGSISNNTFVLKKRIITHQTNKSRLNSINSQYSDLEQQNGIKVEKFLSQNIYKMPGFKLNDVSFGQSQAVFEYALGRQRKINFKLINLWKQSLLHEDKTEIYIHINPQQKTKMSYTHPKILPLNQLQKGFQQIFGTGKSRSLRLGEQSLIIEGIRKYLRKCDEQPMKIARKDFDIISDILTNVKLKELENYPICFKQIQGHLKIMFTRWKYINQENKTNKIIQTALISGKNNFIDLAKNGILAEFLIKNSNKNQLLQLIK